MERLPSGVYSAVKSPRRRPMRQHARTRTSLGNAVPGDGSQPDTGQALRGSRRNIMLCEFHFPFAQLRDMPHLQQTPDI